MSYIVSIITSVVSAILVYILKQVLTENKELKKAKNDEKKVKKDALENGVVCLLRVKLIEYHDRYMKAGSIPSYALQNWLMMFEAYRRLGGNGMIVQMEQEIKELPIR